MNPSSDTANRRAAMGQIAVAAVGPFVTQMDSTAVSIALATIAMDFDTTLNSAQWIVSGYLLTLALMVPLTGWLVDRFGAKPIYLFCFTCFAVASLVCGAAPGIRTLIAARVVQGMAAGLLAPMAQLMIARAAGPNMARVMGYAVVPVLVAPIVGPVLAGTILHFASWRWLFYLSGLLAILAISLAIPLLPREPPITTKRSFDLTGFLAISPGVACLLYGFQHAQQAHGTIVLAIGLILATLFIRHALRREDAALIDVRLFTDRAFFGAALIQFLSNGQLYAGQFLIALFLITGLAVAPAQAGWALAPMGIGMLCSAPLIGLLTDRFSNATVARSGALIALLGSLPFIWLSQGEQASTVVAASLFLRGMGQGAIGIPTVSAAYAAVAKERLAVATTAINIAQRLGGPFATTLGAIVIAPPVAGVAAFMPNGFTLAFILLAALHALTLAATCLMLPRSPWKNQRKL